MLGNEGGWGFERDAGWGELAETLQGAGLDVKIDQGVSVYR